jgi:hypothetical protein
VDGFKGFQEHMLGTQSRSKIIDTGCDSGASRVGNGYKPCVYLRIAVCQSCQKNCTHSDDVMRVPKYLLQMNGLFGRFRLGLWYYRCTRISALIARRCALETA